jgi:hypothetical protein
MHIRCGATDSFFGDEALNEAGICSKDLGVG